VWTGGRKGALRPVMVSEYYILYFVNNRQTEVFSFLSGAAGFAVSIIPAIPSG
jgi:hypothetical protein